MPGASFDAAIRPSPPRVLRRISCAAGRLARVAPGGCRACRLTAAQRLAERVADAEGDEQRPPGIRAHLLLDRAGQIAVAEEVGRLLHRVRRRAGELLQLRVALCAGRARAIDAGELLPADVLLLTQSVRAGLELVRERRAEVASLLLHLAEALGRHVARLVQPVA